MTETKVSVVIPVHNAEKYLPQCLDSVLSQTLREIEVICVDDGSTDRSLEILRKYARKDERIRVIRQENSGAGAARNRGMNSASGKYMIFWDADDFFRPDALARLYRQAEKYQAQICVCGARIYDESEKKTFPAAQYLVIERIPDKQPFSRRDIGKYLFNFSSAVPWNKLFRRSFVEENHLQFQTLRKANDVYFVLSALYRAERIAIVPRSLINYRYFNETSLTGSEQKDSENTGGEIPGDLTGRRTDVFCSAQAYRAVFEDLSKDPGFTEEFRQSLANKAIGPLMDDWRMQPDGERAEELYQYYKETLFPELGLFGKPKEYFNSEIDFRRMEVMQQTDCRGFMLYEMRSFRRRLTREQGENSRMKQMIPIWLRRRLRRLRHRADLPGP